MRALILCLIMLSTALSVLAQPVPEAVLRKEVGNHYLSARQYERARDQYLAALQLDSEYEDAHYNLGVIYYFRLGDYRRALYHFGRYGELVPRAPDMDQVRELARLALRKVEATERAAYAGALRQGTLAAVEDFLRRNPGTVYLEDAHQQVQQLREKTAKEGSK